LARPGARDRTGLPSRPDPQAAAGSDDQQTLLQLHERYFEAFRLGDKRGIQRLAADGFTSQGEPRHAADAPLEIWAGDVGVTWDAGGAAVTGTATLRVRTPDGRHVADVNYRFSEAWAQRDWVWRLASVKFVNAADVPTSAEGSDSPPSDASEDGADNDPDPVDIGPVS